MDENIVMTVKVWRQIGTDLHNRVQDIRGGDAEWGEYTLIELLRWLHAQGFGKLRRAIEERTGVRWREIVVE